MKVYIKVCFVKTIVYFSNSYLINVKIIIYLKYDSLMWAIDVCCFNARREKGANAGVNARNRRSFLEIYRGTSQGHLVN